LRELRKIAPDRSKGLLVDTSVDYDALHEICSLAIIGP
jgi:hypothetical protein